MNEAEQPTESQPHCTTCGVPWASHMGIVGTCAEKAQLRKERDEARRLYCHMSAQLMYKSVSIDTAKHVAANKNWDCFENLTICIDSLRYVCNDETDKNAQLIKERDEARREVCNWCVGVGLQVTSQAVAEERGWDCYKEGTK